MTVVNPGKLPTWSQLFPTGRDLFYEGTTPKKFAAEMAQQHGFDPSKNNPAWNRKHGYQFFCPASALDQIYGTRKYPLGS